jgi:hypothetical protein
MPSDQIYITKMIGCGFGAVTLLFVMPGSTRAQGLANIDAASAANQSTVVTDVPTLTPQLNQRANAPASTLIGPDPSFCLS